MSTPASRRPAPRRSTLAGATPAAPARTVDEQPDSQPAPEVQAAPAGQQTPAPAPEVVPAAEQAPAGRRTKYPPKVSFYQDPADTARVRGAILHTMVSEGSRSLSQFIHHAVMAEVQRLEDKHNGGRPFPPVGARELPQGRPMGE